MTQRQGMQAFDWLIWGALAAAGGYLGLAIHGMADLAERGQWIAIILILILSGCWFGLYVLSLRVNEFIATGRFSAPRQSRKPRKPLALLFALPVGIVIGIVGAQFGLSDMLL